MSDAFDDCRAQLEHFLLDDTGELTLLVDPGAGTIVGARGPCERVLGLPASACLGMALSRLSPEPGGRRLVAFGPGLVRGSAFFGEVGLRHASGATRVVSVRVRPLTDAEGAPRALVRVVDVSEQVNLTLELRRAHVSLQEAFRKLSEQERVLAEARRSSALSLLAAALSHELNNPLSSIASGLSTLGTDLTILEQRWPASAERPEEVGEMAEIAAELCDSVGRIAQIAQRLSELEIPVRRKAFDLRPVLGAAAADFGATCAANDPVEMDSDPAAIRRLLEKLLANARQAAGAQGSVRLSLRPGVDRVFVVIDDSGPGIPLALRARVFDPFFTTRPPGEGLGLGLFLARRTANLLGGDIEFEEALSGARAVVALPCELAEGSFASGSYEAERTGSR